MLFGANAKGDLLRGLDRADTSLGVITKTDEIESTEMRIERGKGNGRIEERTLGQKLQKEADE